MTKKYRFGLDVGTNSLGWSVLELDSKNRPCRIEAAGARVFSEGRDPQSKATLAATRRAARSARRRWDRFKQRQRSLLSELTKMGLFPENEEERKSLQQLNPLELRAKALVEKLEPYEIGRALFHLNQRRGFKSNRKTDAKDDDKQATKAGIIQLQEQLQAEGFATLGAFLHTQREKRFRPHPSEKNKNKNAWDVYPNRAMYEDEFAKIWDVQARRHPGLMTEKARRRIHHVIFTQRPLKPQERGFCAYMAKEKRAFRAMPSFQRYRIYQEVNNLEWRDDDGRARRLVDLQEKEARDLIVGLLECPRIKENPNDKNALVTFGRMKTVLNRQELVEGDVSFNFESPKRKGFDGDQTANVMQHEDYVGPAWHSWDLDKQDAFIEVILDDEKSDDEARDVLMREYGLDYAAAEKCVNAPLAEGTANVSVKAAKLMMAAMRDGIGRDQLPIQSEVASYLAQQYPDEFIDPMRKRKVGDDGYASMERLPYYGEAFRGGRHIIPGSFNPDDRHDDRKYFGGVTNPTVHIALNQIRQVVNELIGRYGHPWSIAIELGRDLPVGADGRKKIEKEQKDNQETNARLDKRLADCGQRPGRENRLRLRLWEELGEDPNGRHCPFTGAKIGIADLFNRQTEIEHLIPFSQSLDDSYANKVICIRKANRDKGQRTPYEAFHGSPPGYDWGGILERVKNLPKSKQWRFQENAREIWNRDHGDFSERHLNDTRYIGRLAREYLECVCHTDKIDVLTGRLTGLLRGHWGLNGILSDGDKKTRDDHRHHAVDAIVIGMISRAMLQKVATVANRAEELESERLFSSGREIDPWDGFRADVERVVRNITVSHKPSRRKLLPGATDGQLHNETAYGFVSGPDSKGVYEVVTRKPVEWFTSIDRIESRTQKIRDARLRDEFKAAFEGAEKAGEKGVDGVASLARQRGIRHIRVWSKLAAVPIRDKSGELYKLYKGASNWGVEIYAYPQGHKKAGKWEGVFIPTFDANQKNFKPGQSKQPHPAARMVMRLQRNDFVAIDDGGNNKIVRLQKAERGGRMYFASPNEANVADRDGDRNDPFNYLVKSANQLQSLGARKVHLSPAGKISRESRPRRGKRP